MLIIGHRAPPPLIGMLPAFYTHEVGNEFCSAAVCNRLA